MTAMWKKSLLSVALACHWVLASIQVTDDNAIVIKVYKSKADHSQTSTKLAGHLVLWVYQERKSKPRLYGDSPQGLLTTEMVPDCPRQELQCSSDLCKLRLALHYVSRLRSLFGSRVWHIRSLTARLKLLALPSGNRSTSA
ncbi:hypothetical protein BCR44DRAFT_1458333 [Catenaria anguillulae PL171]|uniref:Uncharacterized protein n=1 Tax=Catenaria anguillulae PL171 TaxID=765915 RepID=A0A1Y2I0N2_9FUNG|nr:hypothetical protein BCR44DRAFT_1458333 [Catenaria anguillulae PL171]